MSVARKIAGRASDGTLKIVYPPEIETEQYMLLNVKEKSRKSKNDAVDKEQTTREILLPIPSQLQVQSQAQYENSSLGLLGAGFAGRANLTGATDDLTAMASQKYESFKEMFGGSLKVGEDQQDASGDLIASQLISGTALAGLTLAGGKIGGVIGAALTAGAITGNIGDALSVSEKVAFNPHLAVLFKGVGFREFGFQYKFVARNQQESIDIQKLIRALQYHMHPDYFVGNLAFEYPDEFEISFSKNRSDFLFNIKRSVLTSLTVNYNGEGLPVFFEDVGAPVSIDIQMSFQETKIHTKRDYAERYEIENGMRGTPPTDIEQGISGNSGIFNRFRSKPDDDNTRGGFRGTGEDIPMDNLENRPTGGPNG